MTDRLFFAFWPDDALRRDLSARVPGWLAGVAGRPQRPDQWHLTVVFLGSVERARQPALHEAGAALEGCLERPEAIRLDRLEHWRKPQVLCLAAQVLPPGVPRLVETLQAQLARRGFETERRPFRAHLTLARKVREAVPARPVDPLDWPVATLSLVRSTVGPAGSRYEPLARWNVLRAPSDAPGG